MTFTFSGFKKVTFQVCFSFVRFREGIRAKILKESSSNHQLVQLLCMLISGEGIAWQKLHRSQVMVLFGGRAWCYANRIFQSPGDLFCCGDFLRIGIAWDSMHSSPSNPPFIRENIYGTFSKHRRVANPRFAFRTGCCFQRFGDLP